MKKVLMVQRDVQPPGGANMVAVWMMEALHEQYDLTLLTWTDPDFAAIDEYYGTSLSSGHLKVRTVHPVVRRFYVLDRNRYYHQARCYLMRLCQAIRTEYDVVMSADSEVDFGGRGIQYIHYPGLASAYQAPHVDADLPWPSKLAGVLRWRYRPWMIIAGHSFERMKRNLTLVNSEWTGRQVKNVYDIDAQVLYPPVAGEFPPAPWRYRPNEFACVSRLSALKKLDRIVEILSQVRRRHADVKLHLIGSLPRKRQGRDYARQFLRSVAALPWVQVHEDIPRDKLVRVLTRCRYGIHAMEDEHFGIAPAEMLQAGCILFVPNSGGQVEIVGQDERLTFADGNEAIRKILDVMSGPSRQEELLSFLQPRRQMFSSSRFVQSFREIVSQFLNDRPQEQANHVM